MKKNHIAEILIGLGLMVLALLVVFVLIPMGVVEPKKVKFAALNPSYYPRIVGYCLLVIGGLIVVTQLRPNHHKTLQTGSESTSAEGHNFADNQNFAENKSRTALILGCIAAILFSWFWFLDFLGFIVTSVLVLIALMLLAGERRPLPIILIALLTPALLYLFFTQIANIPIPSGILEPILIGGEE